MPLKGSAISLDYVPVKRMHVECVARLTTLHNYTPEVYIPVQTVK